MKIKTIPVGETQVRHLYKCPGCKVEHVVNPDVHKYNGDPDKPTFTPSLVGGTQYFNGISTGTWQRCHSHIRNGMITFEPDSWHDLKGKTVPLEDYTEEELGTID